MARIIPSVFDTSDFSHAELSAARLDGEIVAVDECWQVIDEHGDPLARARSLARVLPPRVIVERLSAAWVLGAIDDPPAVHEVCVDSAARYSRLGLPRLRIREVVITSTEMSSVGPVRVTSPLRTAVDLVRFSPRFGETERSIVARLVEIGGFSLGDVEANLDARRNLPGKLLARERMRSVFDESLTPPLASARREV
ncbi:type IV toxin-antitoxin system AbiEi family antitoxin [Marisediminicola sp. LYQ134]|uniref:type IV toxin-antitoxin system AbiEi family antitoxin n=1 Tax=unclassified Marisediminicola TaxID=2618316 RepID=UPI003982E203